MIIFAKICKSKYYKGFILLFVHPAGQYKTFAPTAVKIKKDINNLSDYQCLSVYLGVKNSEKSGARGSRTLVQTGKPYAFYTLSHR